MTKRDFWKYLTRVHKWSGLVIGVQVLMWFASGAFMVLFPIDDVRGRHLAEQTDWSLSDAAIIPIELAMGLYEGELHGASLTAYAGLPAYALIGDQGTVLVDAVTGAPWKPIGERAVRNAAAAYYKGTGEIAHVHKLKIPPIEYRQDGPVWQVQYDDKSATRLYIDAETAKLNAVRTRLWRVYDTMWMLHIMDYARKDDFNSWWLRLFATSGFFFAASGVLLVVHRVFLRPRPRRT